MKVARALISVSDKNGLGTFAEGLHKLGIELISTSGTAAFLEEAGLPVTRVEDLTGQAELLEGAREDASSGGVRGHPGAA